MMLGQMAPTRTPGTRIQCRAMRSHGTDAPIRLAILDDHDETCEALGRAVAKDARIAGVAWGPSSDADAVRRIVDGFQPDVVLIDPGRDVTASPGLRELRDLRRARGRAFAIVLHLRYIDHTGTHAFLDPERDAWILKGMRTAALVAHLVSEARKRPS